MSATIQVTKHGPRTYSPLSGQTVRGGRLCKFAAGGRIQEAGAGDVLFAGVALTDAIAPEDVGGTAGTDAWGRPILNTVIKPTTVAVAYGGDEVPVFYTANATQGQLLVAGAAGAVTPVTADVDPRLIVGRCTQPGGVVFATNPRGLARLAI
ncbi:MULTISPECIES: hypothetical protein [unclassified Mycobacterium]|uniref:hypothetical protein n=1 Tax=unclassified Mycobacterium TaxID=2642494 RepID=UPI0029C754C4|nr:MULTISPECIES: hypothetical protein [unclassified Mycobacterium]